MTLRTHIVPASMPSLQLSGRAHINSATSIAAAEPLDLTRPRSGTVGRRLAPIHSGELWEN